MVEFGGAFELSDYGWDMVLRSTFQSCLRNDPFSVLADFVRYHFFDLLEFYLDQTSESATRRWLQEELLWIERDERLARESIRGTGGI